MQEFVPSRFGAASTAEGVIAGIDLTGKLAVVTGAAAGIGKETARALAGAGADVVIAGRNKAVLDQAVEDIRAFAKGRVQACLLDLLSLHSVTAASEALRELGRSIDLLILNAGVMACPLARSAEGVESQLATNFIGHAVLTSLLTPALLRAAQPRVISLSSSAHQMSPVVFEDINYERRAYDAWEAYAQSKTANSLLAVQVFEQLGQYGVTAHTLHPGGIRTGLLKHMTGDLGAELAQRYKYDTSSIVVKTIEQGAATTIWAATAPELLNRPVLYLADCQVAPLLDAPAYTHGVLPYALSPRLASALWRAAEDLIGARMPLKR